MWIIIFSIWLTYNTKVKCFTGSYCLIINSSVLCDSVCYLFLQAVCVCVCVCVWYSWRVQHRASVLPLILILLVNPSRRQLSLLKRTCHWSMCRHVIISLNVLQVTHTHTHTHTLRPSVCINKLISVMLWHHWDKSRAVRRCKLGTCLAFHRLFSNWSIRRCATAEGWSIFRAASCILLMLIFVCLQYGTGGSSGGGIQSYNQWHRCVLGIIQDSTSYFVWLLSSRA